MNLDLNPNVSFYKIVDIEDLDKAICLNPSRMYVYSNSGSPLQIKMNKMTLSSTVYGRLSKNKKFFGLPKKNRFMSDCVIEISSQSELEKLHLKKTDFLLADGNKQGEDNLSESIKKVVLQCEQGGCVILNSADDSRVQNFRTDSGKFEHPARMFFASKGESPKAILEAMYKKEASHLHFDFAKLTVR